MSYLFFLSYARKDNELWQGRTVGFVKMFYNDLCQEIERQKGPVGDGGAVGFFDNAEIKPGESWPDKLASALQTSRVFVSIYSPAYFVSEYCGKEWAVFNSRLEGHARKQSEKSLGLILPVLWEAEENVKKTLPTKLSKIQYIADGYGKEYTELGLRSLMLNMDLYGRHYYKFLSTFARRVIEVVEIYNLPPLDNLQPIEDVVSTFPSVASEPLVASVAVEIKGIGDDKSPIDLSMHAYVLGKEERQGKDSKLQRLFFISKNALQKYCNSLKKMAYFIRIHVLYEIARWAHFAVATLLFLLFAPSIAKIEKPLNGRLSDIDRLTVNSRSVFRHGSVSDQFNNDIVQWMPEGIGWRVVRKPECRYRTIDGHQTGLFKATDTNNNIYVYRNFELVIDLRLSTNCQAIEGITSADLTADSQSPQGDSGAERKVSWIIRAQDDLNYYLFDLALARQGQWLNFYINDAGRLTFAGGKEMHIKYNDNTSFYITVEAQRSVFTIAVAPSSDPDQALDPIRFEDTNDRFKQGGVGFSPAGDTKIFLQTFEIKGRP